LGSRLGFCRHHHHLGPGIDGWPRLGPRLGFCRPHCNLVPDTRTHKELAEPSSCVFYRGTWPMGALPFSPSLQYISPLVHLTIPAAKVREQCFRPPVLQLTAPFSVLADIRGERLTHYCTCLAVSPGQHLCLCV
jgi:hypothetical protein